MKGNTYTVKRTLFLISVHGRAGELLGSLPADTVIEMQTDDGPVLIGLAELDDADIVGYILVRPSRRYSF
jgi:hypothetical protein